MPNVTVSDVAVAAVTVPVAPSLKVTRLLPAVVLKPEPPIVTASALMPRFVVLLVTTGTTVATCTGVLLADAIGGDDGGQAAEARRLGAERHGKRRGGCRVTVPVAPSLKVTVLCEAVGSKPKPLMVIVVALMARLAVLLVTTGRTVATWTALLLLTPMRGNAGGKTSGGRRGRERHGELRGGRRGDGADRAVAEGHEVVAGRGAEVRAGDSHAGSVRRQVGRAAGHCRRRTEAATTVATCAAVPLLCASVVTTAVKVPVAVGFVEKVTVKRGRGRRGDGADRAVVEDDSVVRGGRIEAEAVNDDARALRARLDVLAVTTGVTVATCTAVPLPTPSAVTMAVSEPAVGADRKDYGERGRGGRRSPCRPPPPLNTTELLAASGRSQSH